MKRIATIHIVFSIILIFSITGCDDNSTQNEILHKNIDQGRQNLLDISDQEMPAEQETNPLFSQPPC